MLATKFPPNKIRSESDIPSKYVISLITDRSVNNQRAIIGQFQELSVEYKIVYDLGKMKEFLLEQVLEEERI